MTSEAPSLTLRLMTTDEELAKLESEALPSGTRVWVTHFFSHFGSTHAERTAFHDGLRAAGFGTPGKFTEIGADEELRRDGYWHHWAFTIFEANADELRAADERARELATSHGVQYDGWKVKRHATRREPELPERD
jgi:hypothetical protein